MASELNASQLFSFLTQLAANNNREWFKQHKDQYDTLRQQWLDDVQSLINLISQWDDSVHGLNVADAVYRIYRDIRFSPDKSPYKTYFSACFGRGGRRCQSFAHYVHLQPGHSMVGGGVWLPAKDKLCAMRNLIDAEQEEFTKIITNPEFKSRFSFESESLKRVPRDFPADHPLGKYLKMKEFLVVMHVDQDYFGTPDWPEKASRDLSALKPLKDFLDYVYD
ncbi:MAG: DUF2461 domain-containing protein [Sodaliphilus sp.]|nr:DUF2461 domain-containing protein [Sodaliphilus sp.]